MSHFSIPKEDNPSFLPLLIENIYVISRRDERYTDGVLVNYYLPEKDETGIKIEKSKTDDSYLVSFYIIKKHSTLWSHREGMPTKIMLLSSNSSEKVKLIGCGKDKAGLDDSVYELEIRFMRGCISYVSLHKIDVNLTIIYYLSVAKLFEINYDRIFNQKFSLPDLTADFTQTLLKLITNLLNIKKQNTVTLYDVAELATYYTIDLMEDYKEQNLDILPKKHFPIKIVSILKEQVYKSVCSLIPKFDNQKIKEIFYNSVSEKMHMGSAKIYLQKLR